MGTISKQLVPNEHTTPAHSAGPWRICAEDEDYIHIERIKDGEDAGIIDVYCSEENNRDIEECRANARLVAKAPELLALARKLVVVCEDRLAALTDDSDRLQNFYCDDAEADIAERTAHYRAIKDEALKCLASIERRKLTLADRVLRLIFVLSAEGASALPFARTSHAAAAQLCDRRFDVLRPEFRALPR